MNQVTLKQRVSDLLHTADVRLGGTEPVDLQVHDERLYTRVFDHGSLGFGEAYMDGWWDADDLPGMFTRMLRAQIDQKLHTFDAVVAHLKARFINLQRGEHAYTIGKAHYDLGNDLFHAMLG
ncbi:MAG: cyclopropane-fatty-acyl-phospholipid synthase, partial [Rhodanobacter sp.]